jgi:hypothetical protein
MRSPWGILVHEVLCTKPLAIEARFEGDFQCMTREETSLKQLLQTQAKI